MRMSGLTSAATSIHEHQHRSILRRLYHILKLPVSRHWVFQFICHIRHRFKEAQEQAALHRVIHILRQRPGGCQRHRRIQLGRNDAHHVPVRLHQRAARIARLHRQADLEITRVIRRAGQRRDFPRGGRAPAPWARTPANRCRENRPSPRAAQMRRPTWQNGQRGKNPISVNFSGLCHHLHCVIMAITTLSSKDLHLFVYGVFKRLEFR